MTQHPSYDLIGDIHGHYGALVSLLDALGYISQNGIYQHPQGRRLIFLGDLIDRGPQIAEVVRLVRQQVEFGEALCILGNHEYNAIAFHTWVPDADTGRFLRVHSAKNQGQLAATLQAFASDYGEWLDHLEWFQSLPLFLELDGLRAVHACWDSRWIDWVRQTSPTACLTKGLLYASGNKGSDAWQAIEVLLKGWEIALPDGLSYHDAEGNVRTETRLAWWPPSGQTWADWLAGDSKLKHTLSTIPFAGDLPGELYAAENPPVFCGHYWLRPPLRLQAANICCLDYSIAKQGHLVAYRWDGEQSLSVDKLLKV